MKRYTLILLTTLILASLLTGCSCQHQWVEATCETAKTCSLCNAVEAEPLGHSWQEADCETPKTCSRCQAREGNPLGHRWEDASCTTAKTCRVCAATEGQPLDHSWEGEATLYAGATCSVCGEQGDPLPGYLAQNDLFPTSVPCDYITNTYVRPDLQTIGQFYAPKVRIFASDETHRAKEGYEWRCADISITFSDNHANLYGANVICARADYYQDQVLKQIKKQESFKVTYQGKEYACTAFYENTGFYYHDGSSIFQTSCYVQVPVGYDGVVLAFLHGSIDVEDAHLHEVADENTLLFRIA